MNNYLWAPGPCHGPTLFFGTVARTIFGPVELHSCSVCGGQMIRSAHGWMEGRQFEWRDPENCGTIRALTSIGPHTSETRYTNVRG